MTQTIVEVKSNFGNDRVKMKIVVSGSDTEGVGIIRRGVGGLPGVVRLRFGKCRNNHNRCTH